MKKILSYILALCFVFSLAACGEEEAPKTQEPAKTETEAQAQPETPAPTEEKAPQATEGADSQKNAETPKADSTKKQDPVPAKKVAADDPNKIAVSDNTYASVPEYVERRGQDILRDYAENFVSGESKCTIHVDGNTIIIKNCMVGMKDMSPEFKASMQSAYDTLGTSLKEVFQPLKGECPSLEMVIVEHCEENGTPYATVKVALD